MSRQRSRFDFLCLLLIAAAFPPAAATAGEEAAAEPPPEAMPAIVLDGGEGESIPFPLHPTLRLAGPESHLAGMSFFELHVAAGAAGAPPHSHANEDEFFYVREGSVTFMAGDETRTVGPGGFALLPRDGWHAFWNAGESDAYLLVGTSAGTFGDFFDAVAIAAREAGATTPQELGAILGRVSGERGIEIDMSRVPDDVKSLYGM